jgi:serine/threonine protein kinase
MESAPADSPLILNRYRLLEQRAQGGFSTVEVAWDTRMQRRVAIKRIPLEDETLAGSENRHALPGTPTRLSPSRALSRWGSHHTTIPGLEEARTAALLSNPSIVEVYDFEYDSEAAYIIMKYVDGPTLAELMEQRGGMLEPEVIAAVVASVSEALEFAHANRVLHLDIKPANILIDRSGRVLVTDFGISQIATAAGYDPSKGGTIGYMPPEQLRCEEPDERTDEWAFASVVYEMLCGTNPFRKKGIDASLKAIEQEAYEPPSSFRSDISPLIDDVVMCALSPRRDARFSRVADLTDQLLLYLPAPKTGRLELRHVLEGYTDDGEIVEVDHDDGYGLWCHLSERARKNIARIVMCIAGTWLTWQASQVAPVPVTVVAAFSAGTAVVSFVAPVLGAIVALLCFAATLILRGAYVLGGALAICSLLWWIIAGRRSTADAVLPLAAPLLCFSFLGNAYPLLCGFRLDRKHTLAATLFGGVFMLFIAVCTGSTTLITCTPTFRAHASLSVPFVSLCTKPATWLLFAGWIFAGILMSTLCSRPSRMLSILGSACGCLIMLGVDVVIQHLTAGSGWGLPTIEVGAPIGFAFVVMFTIALIGAPYHPDRE